MLWEGPWPLGILSSSGSAPVHRPKMSELLQLQQLQIQCRASTVRMRRQSLRIEGCDQDEALAAHATTARKSNPSLLKTLGSFPK